VPVGTINTSGIGPKLPIDIFPNTPTSEKADCENDVDPKNIVYPYGVGTLTHICPTLGSIGFHNRILGWFVPIFN
jgi:hypothetical protein